MISTSYKGKGFKDLISGLVKMYDPQTIVELGTQQGASAILMAKALGQGHLYTYDLFQPRYAQPPRSPTKASLEAAKKNITAAKLQNKITVRRQDALTAYKDFTKVDILHVDLCNHYQNVYAVLSKWYAKVDKLIILEGGILNKWQKQYGFKSFSGVLQKPFIKNNYDKLVIQKDDSYALTLLARK